MVHLAKTVHLCCTNTNNISNRTNVIPHDPHHLGVPTGASRMIYEPMVRLAQTLHLSYIKTNTISKRTERDSTWPTSTRISIGCIQNDFWSYLALTLTPSPNGPNEIPHDPRHQGVPLGASKMISEPVERLSQTMHLSYIKTNTISKWTKRDSTWPTSPRSSIGCAKMIS